MIVTGGGASLSSKFYNPNYLRKELMDAWKSPVKIKVFQHQKPMPERDAIKLFRYPCSPFPPEVIFSQFLRSYGKK